jgi:transcriptional regulator with GAF, ATPase, and Fis domain
MVNKDLFFREVTVRICSSLDIRTALANVFDYLSEHFPLDTLCLTILDADLGAIRRIANAMTRDLDIPDETIPLSKQLWDQVQTFSQHHRKVFISTDPDIIGELFDSLGVPHLKMKGNSDLVLPLWIGQGFIGFITLRVGGEKRYNSDHLELLGTVAEPFAIALSNALAYEKILKYRDILIDDNRFLSKELFPYTGDEIVGSNSGLRNVMEMVRQVAPLNNSVLLLGETGTGKELIANAIHYSSPRKGGPFVKVNCGAIPENLIDSELFGYDKGAFTGATSDKRGRFERASGGTIFLDEIGELPQKAQVRLLRVLQYREIERVGGNKPIPVDIRVIAATHRNLERMVSEDQFREDLWYRLNIFPIIIPPLRQRKEDIPALARFFVARKSRELDIKTPPAIAPGALQRLMEYSWQGNIRELENLVERELIRHKGGQLMFNSLPGGKDDAMTVSNQDAFEVYNDSLSLDEMMALHIRKILEKTNGRIHGSGGAAEILKIKATTLRGRMDKLGIKYGRNAQSRPGR